MEMKKNLKTKNSHVNLDFFFELLTFTFFQLFHFLTRQISM